MKFTLIVCTYKRPQPLFKLLESVRLQQLYPNTIIIVDGSPDSYTRALLETNLYDGLTYYHVPPEHRGLTKQRNYGIARVADDQDIVCFLDDDIVLKPDYFSALLTTYQEHPDALGVGGYIVGETSWKVVAQGYKQGISEYIYDGYVRSDGSRFVMRKRLGLDTDRPPAHLPDFAHGRSVSFLPPSGKVYPVEQFMGGVSSYKLSALKAHQFSEFFEGYGLYEDADFTFRLSKEGSLYVNTAAQLYHYHDPDGRPNQFNYGKMVIRNGWYVWRVRYPKPGIKARIKWNMTAALLTSIRLTNALRGNAKMAAFTESVGRIWGWWSLLFNKPRRV